jgi:hypothetical protein
MVTTSYIICSSEDDAAIAPKIILRNLSLATDARMPKEFG